MITKYVRYRKDTLNHYEVLKGEQRRSCHTTQVSNAFLATVPSISQQELSTSNK